MWLHCNVVALRMVGHEVLCNRFSGHRGLAGTGHLPNASWLGRHWGVINRAGTVP